MVSSVGDSVSVMHVPLTLGWAASRLAPSCAEEHAPHADTKFSRGGFEHQRGRLEAMDERGESAIALVSVCPGFFVIQLDYHGGVRRGARWLARRCCRQIRRRSDGTVWSPGWAPAAWASCTSARTGASRSR